MLTKSDVSGRIKCRTERKWKIRRRRKGKKQLNSTWMGRPCERRKSCNEVKMRCRLSARLVWLVRDRGAVGGWLGGGGGEVVVGIVCDSN